jgi:hypothetical protein
MRGDLYGRNCDKRKIDLQDVKGPQTVAFNLPNDDRIVKERGSAMVMLKNISQAK